MVFDRSPILSGNLKLTGEEYTLQDCVYVFSTHRFFNNKFILKRLDKIEQLVINGLDETFQFDLKSSFNSLTYLELRNVSITDSTVLKSPNLKKLFIHNAHLSKSEHNYYDGVIGFKNLKANLKHFSHTAMLRNELEFYQACSRSGVFDELETLDVHLTDFKTLIYISNKFTNLKTVNAIFARNRDELLDLFDKNGLGKLVNKLRPDLNVFFFGVPLNKSTYKAIRDFFSEFGSEIRINPGSIALLTNSEWNEMDDKQQLFDGFFKLVDTLSFHDKLEDRTFYDKFTNLKQASYQFWLEIRHGLPDTFKIHPNITTLYLVSFPDGHYFNDILDKIPVYCRKLTTLHLENWDRNIDFNFLLKLPNIKVIRLYLRFAFPPSMLVEMLRQLKYMSFCEIYFDKTEDITKEDLSSFKQDIQRCIFQEIRYRDCLFKIEIHHRKSYMGNEKFAFVR